MYLLVLVSGDGGEDGLREAEGLDSFPAGHRLVGGQLAAEVLPDHVNARLVLVHGVEDDLVGQRERGGVNMGAVTQRERPLGDKQISALCLKCFY